MAADPVCTPTPSPTLRRERALHRAGVRFVIGCDEVGRGALAGPVAVGLCAIDASVRSAPAGLKDSKLLPSRRREELEPAARSWARFCSVGLASNEEIDRLGLTRALGIAGVRALAGLREQGMPVLGSVVLLDGKHDWLSLALGRATHGPHPLGVVTRIKADVDCASVSAASVLAKVHRDRLMIEHDQAEPRYGWRSNKGYGSAAHYAALAQHGPTDFHRRTWLSPSGEPGADGRVRPESACSVTDA